MTSELNPGAGVNMKVACHATCAMVACEKPSITLYTVMEVSVNYTVLYNAFNNRFHSFFLCIFC